MLQCVQAVEDRVVVGSTEGDFHGECQSSDTQVYLQIKLLRWLRRNLKKPRILERGN